MWYHLPKISAFISNLLRNLALLSQTKPSGEIHKSSPPHSSTLILFPRTKISDYSQAWTHLTQVQDPIWLLVFLVTSKISMDQVPVIIKFKLRTLAATFLLNWKDHKALDEPKGSWGQSVLSHMALAMEYHRLFLKNPSQFGEYLLCKNFSSTHMPSPDQLKIWIKKLKQFSYLTCDFSLGREQLPAGGDLFFPELAKK